MYGPQLLSGNFIKSCFWICKVLFMIWLKESAWSMRASVIFAYRYISISCIMFVCLFLVLFFFPPLFINFLFWVVLLLQHNHTQRRLKKIGRLGKGKRKQRQSNIKGSSLKISSNTPYLIFRFTRLSHLKKQLNLN